MLRKFTMTQIWRITQTGPFLSLFFWGAALAGIFWPIVGQAQPTPGPLWVFVHDTLGISADRTTLVGLSLLFVFFSGLILLIGFVYDRVLKLWREQMDIAMERNPYAEDRLLRKEVMQWDQFYLPLARAVYRLSPDQELEDAITRVEDWVATGRLKGRAPR